MNMSVIACNARITVILLVIIGGALVIFMIAVPWNTANLQTSTITHTIATTEFYHNNNSNHLWRKQSHFFRAYLSESCNFIYFTTLKTGSNTHRKMIDTKQCGFGKHIELFRNKKYWKSCGNHNCNQMDFNKMQNASQSDSDSVLSMIFVRHPIARFESLYSFFYNNSRFQYQIKEIVKRMYKTYIDSNETYLIEITNNKESEIKYLLHIKNFLNRLDQKLVLDSNFADHYQPQYLYLCTKSYQCFIPNFIGKTENLIDYIKWIDQNKFRVNPGAFTSKHSSEMKYIEKGITYKYIKDALLPICRYYWNDFNCFGYEIPKECIIKNNQEWKMPYFCVDINNEMIQIPVSIL